MTQHKFLTSPVPESQMGTAQGGGGRVIVQTAGKERRAQNWHCSELFSAPGYSLETLRGTH